MEFYCDVYCVLYTKEEPNFAPVPCHWARLGGRGEKEGGGRRKEGGRRGGRRKEGGEKGGGEKEGGEKGGGEKEGGEKEGGGGEGRSAGEGEAVC